MNIVWLASYPKSGNTFLRLLLYRYIYANSINTTQIEQIIPDLHKLLSRGEQLNLEINSSILVKTHFLFSNDHPYFENTAGFIYILRNPRDVLLSNARYLGYDKDYNSLYSFAESFINNLGVPRWKNRHMGNYIEHLTNWLNYINQFPHLFIKYESLRNSTVETLTHIINFLRLDVNEERIKTVVEECQIDNLRQIEIQEKSIKENTLFDKLPQGKLFIGQGKMNQSLTTISQEIENLYQDQFNNFIHLLGY